MGTAISPKTRKGLHSIEGTGRLTQSAVVCDSDMADTGKKRKVDDMDEAGEKVDAHPVTTEALEWYGANVFSLDKWDQFEKGLPFQMKMVIVSQSSVITMKEVCTTKVCPIGFKAKRSQAHYITALAEDKYILSQTEFDKVMLFSQYARKQRGYFLEIGISWLVVLKDYQVKDDFLFTKRAEWKLTVDTDALIKTGSEVWEVLINRAKEPMQVVAAAMAMSSKIEDKGESWVNAFDGVTVLNLIEKILPVQHVTSGSVASLVSVLTNCAFAGLDHAQLAGIVKDYGLNQSKEVLKMSALPSFRTPDKTQSLHLAKGGVKLDVSLVKDLPDDCYVPLSNVRFTHTSVEALAGPHYRVFHSPQQVAELFNLVGKGQFQKIVNVSYVSGAVVKALANKVKPVLVEGKAPPVNAPPINAADSEDAEWGN